NGIANINSITASFFYPSGLTITSSPVWWLNGTQWISASGQAVTSTSLTKVQDNITRTFGGSATMYINQSETPNFNNLTETYFALSNSTPSITTTTVPAGSKTVCPSGCDYTSLAAALNVASNGDTLFVKGPTTYQGPRITKKVTLKGLTSGGQNAWTFGTAGVASGAPTIVYDGTNDPIITIASDNVEMKGFSISTHSSAVSATAFSGNVSHISITYCDFNIGSGDKAIAVDYGNTVNNLSVNHNRFIGQPTNTSDWFAVSNGTGPAGDGGSALTVDLAYNQITNTMSVLAIDRSIKNIHYRNNTFNNTWDTSGSFTHAHNPYYGYVLIEEPDDEASGLLQGITFTHNTFNNSTGAAPNEFSVLVRDTVEQANVGIWGENLALHYNNFLQDSPGGYPLVGFGTPGASYSSGSNIAAELNYWANAPAAPSKPGHISLQVDEIPWLKAQVAGGVYARINPNSIQQVTDTFHNIELNVDTIGSASGATLIASQFISNPSPSTFITPTFSSGFFDLFGKSGLANINSITATFYYPT
ncbi:MAG: hypothetical protein GY868_11435, partial [Deltaproteobacteria bacterium]|nr:hypothetical protein [Deltaproteobacteria bacterium]